MSALSLIRQALATAEPEHKEAIDSAAARVASVLRVLGTPRVTEERSYRTGCRRVSVYAGPVTVFVENTRHEYLEASCAVEHNGVFIAITHSVRIVRPQDSSAFARSVLDVTRAIARCETAQELYDWTLENRGYQEMFNRFSSGAIQRFKPGKILDGGFPVTGTAEIIDPRSVYTVWRNALKSAELEAPADDVSDNERSLALEYSGVHALVTLAVQLTAGNKIYVGGSVSIRSRGGFSHRDPLLPYHELKGRPNRGLLVTVLRELRAFADGQDFVIDHRVSALLERAFQ